MSVLRAYFKIGCLRSNPFALTAPLWLAGMLLVTNCAVGQHAGAGKGQATTNAAGPAPGPNDARIAYVTARMMEELHYTQRPMDKEISKRFFDGYVDSLDPRHENFLQSDLAEFSHYRTNLDRLTVKGRRKADLSPAFAIYGRYLTRLREQTEYALNWLKEGRFKFDTDDRIALDRHHAPYPKNLAEAQKLWEQQLKWEYLEAKLNRELSATNVAVIPLAQADLVDITNSISRRYRENYRNHTKWDGGDVLQAYLNGLTHAYDPHSDYFNPEHAQDFSMSMNLSMFGIGAYLGDEDGYCTINQVIPGGPAAKSKQLKEKDRVLAVAQGTNAPVNVVDMESGKVVEMIRGPKGTTVRLTISPAEDRSARKEVALVRDEIKMEDQAAKARLIEMTDARGAVRRMGVIDLPSFYAPVDFAANNGEATPKYTSVDVARLIAKLKAESADGIILDLRGNLGGSVEEVLKTTGLFIKDGPVMQDRAPDGEVVVESSGMTNLAYGGPMAVMIDRYSASASEIAAAALQDYDRALIVGDTASFGKGTMQSLSELGPYVASADAATAADPGELKITMRKFYRVSGGSTQFRGVTPDIVLPDTMDHEAGIESEKSLDNALPWDTISSVAHRRFEMAQRYVPELARKSAARVATNEDFLYIQEDIRELEKENAESGITLNEAEAIRERQAGQQRELAEEALRNARPPAALKIYDISLDDAAKPGLPQPEYYPGLWDTNEDSTATVRLQTPGGHYSAADLALAQAAGLNLATGAVTNHPTAPAASVTITNATAIIVKYTKLRQPDLDPQLRETTEIMSDYISLLTLNLRLTKT